jgi:hypothetical protein
MRHDIVLAKAAKVASGANPPATPDFSGAWRNQLGSTMQLTVTGTQVSGSYESAVSSGGGTIRGDLTGHVNGDLIAFTVNWPVPAITAWVGQLTSDGGNDVITTLWQMTTNVPDNEEPRGLWQSVLAGADRFAR